MKFEKYLSEAKEAEDIIDMISKAAMEASKLDMPRQYKMKVNNSLGEAITAIRAGRVKELRTKAKFK